MNRKINSVVLIKVLKVGRRAGENCLLEQKKRKQNNSNRKNSKEEFLAFLQMNHKKIK